MKEIPLSRGKTAIVDDEDYEWLSRWKWSCTPDGYACHREGQRMYRMHRLILDVADGFTVDHINGNRLDNRRANLRPATVIQQHYNMLPRQGCSSQFKGVRWHRNRRHWYAEIRINGRKVHLGTFDDETSAAQAYDAAAREHFGEFARTNFDNGLSRP